MDKNFWVAPDLDALLADAINTSFPELQDNGIKIGITEGKGWGGMMGTHLQSPIVILYIPKGETANWDILRAILFHELSHFIGSDSDETREVFYTRADGKSAQIFRELELAGMVTCRDRSSLLLRIGNIYRKVIRWFRRGD